MDKVRAFLKVVYLQRFWVLSVVGVIVAVICWKLSSGSLDAEFVTNKSTIDSRFNEMNAITGKSVHGNPSVNENEREQAIIVRDKVLKLWQTMYERQKEEVLKWPSGLGDDFLEAVANKKFRDPIGPTERQRYRTYAKDWFPKLVEMVQAKKDTEGNLSFGGGRDGGDGGRFTDLGADAPMYDAEGNLIEPENYLVVWQDQAAVRQKLTFAQLPTPLQVWVTQEDMWVYETLLRAINNTNETHDATRPDNAAIRMIMALEVGRNAALAAQTRGALILPPGGGGAEAGLDGPRDGSSDGATGDADAGLMANRYIGDDGQPVTDASTDPGGEYRMLPVRMQLFMEEEAIPDILIECANAALPVEVKRVRVNPEQSAAGFEMTLAVAAPDAGGGGSTDGGRGGGDGSYRGFDSGRGSSDGGRGDYSSAMTEGLASTGLAKVEIFGIVYIYNPPDADSLAVPGGDTAEVAATDAATAAL